MEPIPMNLTRAELERWAYAENDVRLQLALAARQDDSKVPLPQTLLQSHLPLSGIDTDAV